MKMWNYAFIMVGMSLLLEIAGLTSGGGILATFGFSITAGKIAWVSFDASTFYTAVGVILSVSIAGGVIIGFLTKSSSENYIILPFIVGTLYSFLGVFYSILGFAMDLPGGSQWITAIIVLLLGPFIPLFLISCIEFFRGTD